ncbi:helix-turn-helix domain-containing protein [Acidithiobacillus sp.]|uniref:helix-turn-helix domain-containing protein n=1 Tax=Acidithiobacillus sp. TaxID=1872118 RepID=UPI0026353A63|nr:helix-turn-helix domain-containing protein [Acidithiobacillus sp.]MDD2751066.1 helix-turn-helix domain-containing protein [Acidithiobacillus sp.]MDD5280693.1 helix-turn-helix domain-containing protein [Acidithiobacillus sp.]
MDTPISTIADFSSVLKRLRLERSLTQKRLGEKLGLSQKRISAIEAHPEQVSLDQILTVLMALGAHLHVRTLDAEGDAIVDTGEASW